VSKMSIHLCHCRLVGHGNRSPYLKIAEARCRSIQSFSRLPGCLSHETMLHQSLNLISIKKGRRFCSGRRDGLIRWWLGGAFFLNVSHIKLVKSARPPPLQLLQLPHLVELFFEILTISMVASVVLPLPQLGNGGYFSRLLLLLRSLVAVATVCSPRATQLLQLGGLWAFEQFAIHACRGGASCWG